MHRTVEVTMNALDFVVQFPFSWRQSRARALREDMTRDRFIHGLGSDELERQAAGMLWDKLIAVAVVPDFRPFPDDNFLYMYGLADEDLDEDIILAILTSLGRILPSPAVIRNIGPIASPKEFVQLVRQTVPSDDEKEIWDSY